MPIETYRLELREDDAATGLDVTVYGDDDLVETSTRITYEAYGLEPAADREDPAPIEREVTADVTTTDVQFERDGAGFSVRLLGDREVLLAERVDDESWGLA
ncbi:hypothetical protein [Salinilacihabitans rarus]|uniref:hypothetical protein n=1 Tax=Salinilacihabitans rarus TaxID=2961596 RepID=UPI0020C93843|nr:hypothetical protein [Salinilacihabitans rarus]